MDIFLNAEKFLSLTVWYCFKAEGTLHITNSDLQKFVHRYNKIYNDKTLSYNTFLIPTEEISYQLKSHFVSVEGDKMALRPNLRGLHTVAKTIGSISKLDREIFDILVKETHAKYSESGLKLIPEMQNHFYKKSYGFAIDEIDAAEKRNLAVSEAQEK